MILHEVKLPYIENPSNFKIHKGVNLSHWLSQTQPWAQKDRYITIGRILH